MGKLRSSDPPTAGKRQDLIRQRFLANGNAGEVLDARSAWVDSVVTAAYADLLAPAYPQGLAVLAVGGFGRRELFPNSDVDLLLLAASGQPAGVAREALSRFLQVIWDSDLRLSHSVRTVRECCELHHQNIELNISLLDQRLLAGDEALYQELMARLPKFFTGQRMSLSRHLAKLARQRHAKFHDTIYHLEPHIKDTPGGLRDLHMIHWLARLRGGERPEWPAELEGPRGFLHSLRCFLHYRSGRDNNLLSFDAQEEIVEQGFLPFRDASQSMREYYRHARGIFRATLREMDAVEGRNNSLLAGFRDWRSRLSNNEFTVARERVLFKAPQHLEKDPDLALRLFQFVARHRVSLHAETERRIRDYLPVLAGHFGGSAPLWPALRELLGLPHASYALRAMHETGLLGAIFSEWSAIECFVLRDFHHRYTVDEHTLITIENLEELRSAPDNERGRFAGLLAEIGNGALLKLVLLFHDVGKAVPAGDHCAESVRLALEAADRIQMTAPDLNALRFLIENHLVLSAAMTSRDLDDPDTAKWLAHRVETLENLKQLALLTYCDIGAVNPTALTPWRMEQLWRVYLITHRELTRELESERIVAPAGGSPERDAFLKGFPTRYLRIHSEADIDCHLELNERRRQSGVAVDIRKQGVYHLTVVAGDRLFLFASIAGALSSFGMNILKAEAFSNQQGIVLDTFDFEDPQRTLELNPPEMDRLRQTLERVILGKVDVKTLLKTRPAPAPPSKGSRIPGRVVFDSEASATATLVEVVAEDRPGLLYDLASAFSEAGCNIEVVLVDTEAHKALDVFYVTANGRKLELELRENLQERLLAACGT